MLTLIVLLVSMAMSIPAYSQVTCFSYSGGHTLSCDGPRGHTSITELSRGAGVIQTDRDTIPYSIIGRDEQRSAYGSDPLPELDRLPSLREESPYRSSTFEEREAIRESGRIPW